MMAKFHFKKLIQGLIIVNFLLAGHASAEFIDAQLLEKAKPFLEMVGVAVVNRSPRTDCRVDHSILGNLIMNSDKAIEVMTDRLSDIRFTSPVVRGFLWTLGIDPDYPEPLELWSCKLYEMLLRFVNGETVNVIDGNEAGSVHWMEVMGYRTFNDARIMPLEQMTITYYLVNGEREYFFNESGQIVYPYYTLSLFLKPAHLEKLKYEKPDTSLEMRQITLAEFFHRMKNQEPDVSHEIWEMGLTPENNMARLQKDYVDINTAPEYEEYRRKLNFLKELFR